MVSVSILAGRAIRWLGRALRFYKTRGADVNMVLATVRSMGVDTKILDKFFGGLVKVEKMQGAHTSAWKTIEYGAKNNIGMQLTKEDIKYLYAFKKVFDKTLKKKFSR